MSDAAAQVIEGLQKALRVANETVINQAERIKRLELARETGDKMSSQELAAAVVDYAEEIQERMTERDDLEVELEAARKEAEDEATEANAYARKLAETDQALSHVLNALNRSGYKYGFDPEIWRVIADSQARHALVKSAGNLSIAA